MWKVTSDTDDIQSKVTVNHLPNSPDLSMVTFSYYNVTNSSATKTVRLLTFVSLVKSERTKELLLSLCSAQIENS